MANSLNVTNPFDLSIIGSIKLCDWAEVDNYLDESKKLILKRENWLPSFKRIEILKNVCNLMSANFDYLAFLIANEGGKPLVDAKVEVLRAIDGVKLCISELINLSGNEIPMGLTPASNGKLAFTTKEPIGVVVAVSAFNHPLNLIVHQVAPAVAVGCPVLVKPADDTPLSCETFINYLYEAGLPKPWCRFVPCELEVAEKLVTDERISFFSFIGSAKVGWMLRSKLANGTRCALEHGGAAPVIIDENVNLEEIIPKLVKGGFYHSGQVCVSVQRVFAPHKEAQKISNLIGETAKFLKVGNAIFESTDCGPLIRAREVERVSNWVEEAIEEGANLITGGKKIGETCFSPTVLLNPSAISKVSKMEIFGPIICVYGYKNVDDAINQANSLPYSFQSAVYTNRLDFATYVIKMLDASAVMVNEHTAFRVDWMPFAGRKESGYGVGGIGHTMKDMTHNKMIIFNY